MNPSCDEGDVLGSGDLYDSYKCHEFVVTSTTHNINTGHVTHKSAPEICSEGESFETLEHTLNLREVLCQ